MTRRVSTPHMLLSMRMQGSDLLARVRPAGTYTYMLSQDLDHSHYPFDMRLRYEGIDWADGDAAIGALLTELDIYDGVTVAPSDHSLHLSAGLLMTTSFTVDACLSTSLMAVLLQTADSEFFLVGL